MKSRMPTSNMIVPEGLTKDNYGDWKIFMKNYLLGEGLWDIVEGTECKPKPTSPEFKNWRQKNGKALHAILVSCEEQALSIIREMELAKDAWDQLAQMVQEMGRPTGEGEVVDMYAVQATRKYGALNQAAFWGNWERTKSLLEVEGHPDEYSLLTAPISTVGGTVLHVAVAGGHLVLVEKLVELIITTTKEESDSIISTTTRKFSYTALHYAARAGFTKIAEVLVKNSKKSLEIPGEDGLIPVAVASLNGHKDTIRYLYQVTRKEAMGDHNRMSGATLLTSAILYDMFDIVVDLLGHYPQLAIAFGHDGGTAIQALARSPNAFPSGVPNNTWQHWIYSYAPIYIERDVRITQIRHMGDPNKDHTIITACRWLCGVVWSALNLLIPSIKSSDSKKKRHGQALQALECICCQISTLDEEKLQEVGVYNSLFLATELGIAEIFNKLIKTNPFLLLNDQNRNILLVAIQYQQEKIFNLICGISGMMPLFSHSKDNYQNTILHVAGKSPHFSHNKGKMPGAALQLQRELQWFQEVEKIVPLAIEFRNSKGMKPREVFTEEHKDLVREGEKWMKDTANSCMIVATLIATFTFAAAFNAPGGFNQNSGFPIFLSEKLFFLFIISDALSLFSSSTSFLMFLSIYTSRYEEEDFLNSLPKQLIIGLSTLFFSIATMMVAFCATMFLILNEHHNWISIPITFLAGVPVTLFVLLQFPLFLDMVTSTYGPGLFSRPN